MHAYKILALNQFRNFVNYHPSFEDFQSEKCSLFTVSGSNKKKKKCSLCMEWNEQL